MSAQYKLSGTSGDEGGAGSDAGEGQGVAVPDAERS